MKTAGTTLALTLAAAAAVAAWCAPAWAASGGPDAFGYTWADSTEPDGPAFNYEIDNGAEALDLDDDAFTTVPLPFTFPYYGGEYTTVDVHSNGVLSFGASGFVSHDHDCASLSPALGVPTILPYWTDLNPADSDAVGVFAWSKTEPEPMFVVEWYAIPLYQTNGTITLEVKLYATGIIEFHYLDLDVEDTPEEPKDDGADAAIGISQNDAGLLMMSCDSASLVTNGVAIRVNGPGCEDLDGDGVTTCAGDCDDTDRDSFPGADERCDGVDNDCDGEVPADELDEDSDGYPACAGDCNDTDATLEPADEDSDGYSTCEGDCDDGNAEVSPADRDNDGTSGCDGDCDDLRASLNVEDEDGDGVSTCDGDCDDEDTARRPGLDELCDGIDNDCDDEVDENPNCAGPGDDDDDDDDLPPGWDIPYGCILNCGVGDDGNAGATGGTLALAMLLVATLGGSRRRRRPAA